jgi:hypothetical protein
MLTSKPRKKKRGRQPPDYGPKVCPLDGKKLYLGKDEQGQPQLYCKCGWKE